MEFLKQLTLWQQRSIAATIGGVAGYAYYYYIGCVSGSCAITSNPYISTLYGMVIGVLLIDTSKNKKKEVHHGNDNSTTGKEI